MTSVPRSRDFQDWRSSGLLLLVIATPLSALALQADDGSALRAVSSLANLMLSPAALVAAVAPYAAYRIHPRPEVGWLTVALTALGTHTLFVTALYVSPAPHAMSLYAALTNLVVVGSLVTALVLAPRRDVPLDPMALGLLAGTGLGILRILSTALPGPATVPHNVHLALSFLLLASMCLLVTAFVRLSIVPFWARTQIAAIVALAGLTQFMAVFVHLHQVGQLIALLAETLAVGLMCVTGLALLREAMADREKEELTLAHQVHDLESDSRLHRARLHEIGATLSGISCATSLIRSTTAVPAGRRHDLETMVEAELSRLSRLLSAPETEDAPPQPATFGIDDALRPVVMAHQLRGQPVVWRPSGIRAIGQPDQLAEVLNILLDNAAKHGGCDATVEVRREDDLIRITVSDSGPGVTANVALFQWGAAGPTSQGQGIGLHIARSLMEELHGALRLEPSTRQGTTFVLDLPAAPVRSRRADAHVA